MKVMLGGLALILAFGGSISFASEGKWISKDSVVGNYHGKTSKGERIQARVYNESDDTRFEQLMVEIEDNKIRLGLDLTQGVYRGFTSYQCDDAGCLQIYSYKVRVGTDKKGRPFMQIEMDGFVEEDDDGSPAYELKYTGSLGKKVKRKRRKKRN